MKGKAVNVDTYVLVCTFTPPKLLDVEISNLEPFIHHLEMSVITGVMTLQSKTIFSKIAFFDREKPF